MSNNHPAGDFIGTVTGGYLGTNRFNRASIFLDCYTDHGTLQYAGELEGDHAHKTLDALKRQGWVGKITDAVGQLTGKRIPLWVKHKMGQRGGVFVQVYISKGPRAQPKRMTPEEEAALAARLDGVTSEPAPARSTNSPYPPVDPSDIPFGFMLTAGLSLLCAMGMA